jgi:hypothetical protein
MEKFKKLSRGEMKNVTGGSHAVCTLSGGGTYQCNDLLDASDCLIFCLADYGSRCTGCAKVLPAAP